MAPQPARVKYNLVQLDANQMNAWTECKASLQYTQPAMTHLFYKMMNPDDTDNVIYFTKDIPTMATDGLRILANPDFFFNTNMSLKNRVFGVCHEIGHAMFHHCALNWKHATQELPVLWQGKSLPYVFVDTPMGKIALANLAQDYVINAMLKESDIGEMKKEWLYDPNIATGETSWQEAYHKLFAQCQGGGGGGGKGKGGAGQDNGKGSELAKGTFDQHLAPGDTSGSDPQSAEAQPNEQMWQQAIIGATVVGRAAGKLPATLEKIFEAFLKPKVDWTDHIRALFARGVGGDTYDYRQLDRRLITRSIGAPGRTGHGARKIAIGMDSSGSIYAVPQLIERFFAEAGGILEDLRPEEVIVVWCDAQVQRIDRMEDESDLQEAFYKGAVGGGGTSFIPVFDWLKENDLEEEIDALVYLTDGDGSFPDHAPSYPVIWGDISHDKTKYPFGDVVDIPSDGTA
jgi:predicted metal-dependent peptidase